MKNRVPGMLIAIGLALLLAACGRESGKLAGGHLRVAAHNSSKAARETADFVCGGANDQVVINKALQLLQHGGGSLSLAAGDYAIGKDEGYGGINIFHDNITLSGEGPSTRLHLADNQDCNVIRVYGVNNVTVKNLLIDANGEKQAVPPPGVENAYTYFRRFQFELSGIMVRRNHTDNLDREEFLDQHEPTNIVIDGCHVKNAKGLNIMLFGNNVRAINNYIYDCANDGIELLIGPGEISNNTVIVDRKIGDAAIGTDKADNVNITNNIISINDGATVSYAIRTWHGHGYHLIANNQILIAQNAKIIGAVESRTFLSTISGNIIRNKGAQTLVSFAAGSVLANNIIQNCLVGQAVSPVWKNIASPQARPEIKSVASQNIFVNSSIVNNEQGQLEDLGNVTSAGGVMSN